ncbi:MAG: hypothetical protein ACYTEQ_27130 [Planctomycetota bacterium]|jgi:hypothetical protein
MTCFNATELQTIVNTVELLQDETGLGWTWCPPQTYVSDYIPTTQVRYAVTGPDNGLWNVEIRDGQSVSVMGWFEALDVVEALQTAIDPIHATILNGPPPP